MPSGRYFGCCWISLRALCFALLLQPLMVWAQMEGVPEKIPGAETITAEQIVAEVEEHPDLVIIDSRLPGDRLQGYIEGSVNLPDTDTSCANLAQLVPSLETPTLFYCNGVKCPRSENAISVAVSCGYQKVYWFRGGFAEWKAKDFPYLRVNR